MYERWLQTFQNTPVDLSSTRRPKVRPTGAILNGSDLLFYLLILNEIGGKEGYSSICDKDPTERNKYK